MTLVSKDGSFVLGFFTPGKSTNRYLGIWYNNNPVDQTVVWVANRLNPINDSSGVLMVNSSGSLVLLSQNSSTVAWSANSTKQALNPIVQLLDSGNLVLGWDSRIGLEWHLSAWKSLDDPSPGELTNGIERHNYAEKVMKKGSKKYFRTGLWNGNYFSGVPALKANTVFNYIFVSNKDESPVCQCLEGFKPKSSETWNPDEWSKGCVRKRQLSCQDKDKIGFVKFVGIKLPDTTNSWMNRSMNLEECRVKCLNNCSCTAYSNSNISDGGSGCIIWYRDLIDIRQISANEQELYIRMSASDIEAKKGHKMKLAVVVVAATLAVVFGMLLIGFYICRSRTNLKDLSTIAGATDNFAINNKLGEGGFGSIYKGVLEDEQEIAVKRLSRSSGQGLNEFKNEVRLIAKLQHRNLVKLLAYYFGMARTFAGDQSEGNTNRVVGTYGYMAPEYAFEGHFSTKSDVFSFGILLLEIISGKKCRAFFHPNHNHNLIGHAWILWNEGRPLELVDECLGNSCTLSEVLHCIHLSLLCVQHRPEDRPSMSSVVVVLGSESALPQPKKPGFFFEKDSNEAHGFSIDSITPSQYISDGKSSLVSKDGSFELGFFNPGSSKNHYLGIWYKKIPVQTVVWVANRLNPINDSSGLLMINSTGSVVLMSQNKSVVWSIGLGTQKQAKNPMLQLLDSGNLVLRDGNSGTPLWESFDYPSDTFLPGLKMGWDLRKGTKWHLTAWKSPDDPSPGDFTYGIEMHSYPEPVIWKGTKKFYRTGPWNGLRFSGSPDLKPNPVYDYNFVSTEFEVYYTYTLKNESVISRIVLNQTSNTCERYIWIEDSQVWHRYTSVPRDYCDYYGLCGSNGNCISTGSPVCQCLQGFKPKSLEKWSLMDWSQGCVRNKPLSCHKDGFVKFVDIKLPDTTYSWVNESMGLKECSAKCLNNCSCMAYTNSDIRKSGSGCVMWFGDLVDIRQFPSGGQELYIRMSGSELEARHVHKIKKAVAVVAALAAVSGMLLVGFYICRSRTNLQVKTERSRSIDYQNNEGQKEDLELPFLDLSTIACATNNFAINNKLGEGGFGSVYKGILDDKQEIAVKRLSKSSGQGVNEFKNEMHPKISDFGMARTFGGDQSEGSTNRVVGTYGYMAPEYAFDGQFSTKSDVFSFGILLLEIISGKKSRAFCHPDHSHNLIGHAWILWNEDRPLELIDEFLRKSCTVSEVLRCIHLSLLCVQQRPEDRPSISSVIVMLGSESALPQPKQPGFFLEKDSNEGHCISSKHESSSTNEITVTLLEAR
uniref:non-specific serine/threonine protein kinase n=1 Tax=Fagus sylvatica TaxID=28930 RepID=A0A2N9FCP0_FAGSY